MKALTVWQPWASLIMVGAKPFEFRRWDYRARAKHLEGQRIVVHAGARPVRRDEILDMIERVRSGESGLRPEIALPLTVKLLGAYKCQGVLELSAGLGTAVLGTPRPVTEIFSGAFDSDRLDHAMWGWPMEDVQPFAAPIPARGAQGFWNWGAL